MRSSVGCPGRPPTTVVPSDLVDTLPGSPSATTPSVPASHTPGFSARCPVLTLPLINSQREFCLPGKTPEIAG